MLARREASCSALLAKVSATGSSPGWRAVALGNKGKSLIATALLPHAESMTATKTKRMVIAKVERDFIYYSPEIVGLCEACLWFIAGKNLSDVQ
jgi:hypothetical protein